MTRRFPGGLRTRRGSVVPIIALALALAGTLGLGSASATGNTASATRSGAATDNGAGNLGLRLSTTASGRVRVSWTAPTKNSKIRRWVVRTSTARSLVPDPKRFTAPARARSLVVPHAALVTPASGDSTFVKLELVRKDGQHGYSPTKWVKAPVLTAPGTAAKIVVGTFNVRTRNNEPSPSAPWSWTNRRDDVASTIVSSGAGVVALQEAGGVLGAPGYTQHQYSDLLDLLPNGWRVSDSQRYQSARGDGGGLQGTRIIYDSTLYTALSHGVLEAVGQSQSAPSWTPWVQLRDKASGTTFYVISVHFETGVDAKGHKTLYNLRLTQARAAIALAKSTAADGSEVILAGDFNSTALTLPNNGVHREFVKAGFFDAFSTGQVTGGDYPTTNNFDFPVRPSPLRRDYIMSYGPVRGSYWYRNIAYSTSSHPASDHFMQVAQLAF